MDFGTSRSRTNNPAKTVHFMMNLFYLLVDDSLQLFENLDGPSIVVTTLKFPTEISDSGLEQHSGMLAETLKLNEYRESGSLSVVVR